MKFSRRSFWKLAGTGALAASIRESAFSDAEDSMSDDSLIPLTDIVDHLNPCFADHTPGSMPSKPSTR